MQTRFCTCIVRILLAAVLLNCVPPYVAGLWYAACGHRKYEQAWLDRAIQYLTVLHGRCDDPQLRDVLAYTIKRYDRIGAWGVMVLPCWSPFPDERVLGINWPLCPGLTLDPEVLHYPIHEGALILVHEALHDCWPCWGHGHVDPIMERLEQL